MEPDTGSTTTPDGPVVAGGGTTRPLRDRGDLPRLARPEGCYAARRSPLRGKAGLASRGTHGPDREVFYSLRWTDRRGPRIKLDWTTRAASSRPRPNGTRRLMPEHDRVGTGLIAIRGYEPEEPAARCEGTCAYNCNNPLSAVVTVYGPTAFGEVVVTTQRFNKASARPRAVSLSMSQF